jgi:double-stranded uracil-DNA glycosylase
MDQMITERLTEGLRIIFIGFNPSIRSHELGFNYSGKNNRFYTILYQSGLTKRFYAPSESPNLLHDCGYGFTNIVARPTKRADELTSEEYAQGRIILRSKLEQYRPHVACFVGKGVYQRFAKRTSVPWGFQECESIPGVRDFVGPSTSGLVRMKLAEQIAIYSELAAYLDETKMHSPDPK